jgi:predicted alpha/beta-hydrolase family hydrolase
MTSTAAAEAGWRAEPGGAHDQDEAERAVHGIVFFGFPLHAPGRDSADRGAHLAEVGLPMLFLQGTRDKLANLDLLRPLLAEVRPPPSLHVVVDADHGFHVPKRSGRSDEEVLDELCRVLAEWARSVLDG